MLNLFITLNLVVKIPAKVNLSTIGLCCVLHLFLILPILMLLAMMINIFLACLQKTEMCFNKIKERPIKTCTVANRSQFVGICRRNLNIFPAVLRLQNKYLFHSSFFYSLKIDSDFFSKYFPTISP